MGAKRSKSVSIAALVAAALAGALLLSSCMGTNGKASSTRGTENYLTFLDDEPSSVDPQCISEDYTVPLNIYDRLVEVDDEGDVNVLVPSLADSWEVSEDGLVYTFHLREGVTFSNGEALTSEDVGYTLRRLLTHPNSRNRDLATSILGATALRDGTADDLEGFKVIDDLTFSITLEKPSASFLAGLSTPGASILDETTTEAAGDSFGISVETSIGTGPFVLEDWSKAKSITMVANKSCWCGAPRCEGLKMLFYSESNPMGEMYESGMIDILDVDKLGMDAEYFLRGDVYLRNLFRGDRVGISYIALNESVQPLNDPQVRKALQLALDREELLQAAIGGRGVLENGILPRGLTGHNPGLEAIPYDPDEARRLLEEAGYPDGFELEIEHSVSSSQSTRILLELAASMWQKVGIKTTIVELKDADFSARRTNGELTCYAARWSADYDDPINFMGTFFGSAENSRSRSLCYADQEVMRRVQDAQSIVDEDERIAEYQELEKKIVQEDAAWIPLYSQVHFFVVHDRVDGFRVRWNGWSSNRYDTISVAEGGGE